MDSERIFQCQGDGWTYIQHLELRVLDLESTRATSRCPRPQRSQQLAGVRSRPCDVCQNPDRYPRNVSQGNPVDIAGLDNQSSPGEFGDSTLQVEFWQPQKAVRRKKRTVDKEASSRKTDLKDLSEIYSKFESLPESDNWKALFSCDEGQRQSILRHLISGLTPSDEKSLSELSPNSLICTLRAYSKSLQGKPSAQAKPREPKIRPFTCFRELVFCSMCAVARIGVKSETVYNIMRSVYGSDACSERYRALIRGARWANEVAYYLSKTQYGLRGWDLVYAVERQVDHFTRLNSTIEPGVLISGLDEVFYRDNTPETSMPFAIPSIIQRIFNYEIPMEDICQALGYPHSEYEKLELSHLERFLLETRGKRKTETLLNSPKRRRQNTNVSSKGDYAKTSTHRSSSTGYSSTPRSPTHPEIDSTFEADSPNKSTPTQGQTDTDTPGLNNEITDASNHNIRHSISPSAPRAATEVPSSSTGDGWANSFPLSDHDVLLRLFPHDVPQPGSIDAYTYQIDPLEVPDPGLRNIWAGSSLGPNAELIIEHFPHVIPQPNSVDAYTDQDIPLEVPEARNSWRDPLPVHEQEIPQFLTLEIPCLDSVDAYANQPARNRNPQDPSNNSSQIPLSAPDLLQPLPHEVLQADSVRRELNRSY